MDALTPDELLEAAARHLLEAGPAPVASLLQGLDALGRLDYLRAGGVDEEDLAEAVTGEMLLSDAIWVTTDDVIALTAPLLDGMVLTHRLTAEELANGEVGVEPDLVVLDWDSPEGLDLPEGRLRVLPPLVNVPGEDRSTLFGPPGWLDGFEPGDLVAFTRRGSAVSVERAEPGDDDAEVAALRRAAEGRIPHGECEEADPLVLDALVLSQHAFRCPVRPLGDLLEAAGLERRGFSVGWAGDQWRSAGELHRERKRGELDQRWGFDPCCARAFDVASEALASIDPDDDVASGFDPVPVAVALEHGAVAPALAAFALDEGHGDALALLAEAVIRGLPPRRAAPAMLLAALGEGRHGEALAAESMLQRALRADPGYGPVAFALAGYEIDRGELRRALNLLRHPDLTPHATVLEDLEELLAETGAPYRHVGRNDRCPCGSGRKFKLCCQASARVPMSVRSRLLTYKLVRFAAGEHLRARLVGVASSACDDDDPDLPQSLVSMAADPLILDFVIFEGGVAETYLDRRGELLPEDEYYLLEQLIDEPRRLWEITHVEPGAGLTLRDTASGDVVRVAERLGSAERSAGEFVLARVGRMDDQYTLAGVPIAIPLRLRDSAIALVDSRPDADALAAWYGQAIAFPRLLNREGEPLVLCHAEVATESDLAAVHVALGTILDADDDSQWTETWIAPEGDQILRGSVRYAEGRLSVDTNSVERLERLLALVVEAVPDGEVVVDERVDPRQALRDGDIGDGDPAPDDRPDLGDELPPELAALADEFIRQKEIEWIDESIPALGGLTPRQALVDPTRREDLVALLREMEERTPPGTARGFDAARLRALLGFDRGR